MKDYIGYDLYIIYSCSKIKLFHQIKIAYGINNYYNVILLHIIISVQIIIYYKRITILNITK